MLMVVQEVADVPADRVTLRIISAADPSTPPAPRRTGSTPQSHPRAGQVGRVATPGVSVPTSSIYPARASRRGSTICTSVALYEYGQRQAETEHPHELHVSAEQGRERYRHHQGRGGYHPAGASQSQCDTLVIVGTGPTRLQPVFADPR